VPSTRSAGQRRHGFAESVQHLTAFWQNFRSHLVLRSDWPGVIRQASRFVGHSLLGLGGQVPVALLDSRPLRKLLHQHLDLDGIAHSWPPSSCAPWP
jgi:NTE family protein